jgi:3-oxoacyl-[acyl-carrier protein] reductase
MARILSDAGYRIIAIARSESEDIKAASAAARAAGNGAIEFRACDLAELGQIASLVRSVRAEFGPIYGLVNNAGLGSSGLLGTMRDKDIERLIRLNTISPIVLTKYVARTMMSERNGRIVNIASIVASTGYSGLSVYSATKASLVGFTRALARELGQLGITVNAIAPGFIDTAMTNELTESQREQIARRSALKRMADADDVARSVEFLLGPSSRNITGIVLTVDAGNTA